MVQHDRDNVIDIRCPEAWAIAIAIEEKYIRAVIPCQASCSYAYVSAPQLFPLSQLIRNRI
jgi:hypothetical protein